MSLPPIAAGTRPVNELCINPKVPELLAKTQYEQRTPAWYAVRKGLMTASDAAGALGIAAYKGHRNVRESLLDQKVSGTFTGNHMTRWGCDNEDQVRERAMQAVGECAWEVGLVVHEDLPWLGASPDGITNTGRLIEIKVGAGISCDDSLRTAVAHPRPLPQCPYKRKPIPYECPHHYWPQIQVQLECTNLDSCYFIQWQPAHLAVDGEEVFSIVVVERDRKWFAENVDELKRFWVDLMALRKVYVPPPPPTCGMNRGMYGATVPAPAPAPGMDKLRAALSSSSDDEIAPMKRKKTFVVEDSDDEELQTLKAKLQDAIDAVDLWSHRLRKRKGPGQLDKP